MDRQFGRIASLAVVGLLGLALAAPASASSHANVRVLHASPDAPAVDVYLDETIVPALTNVPFGVISDYLEVPAGDHDVKVYATGTTTGPVIDADVTLATGASYTIAATNAVASIEAQVITDDPATTCASAFVRVIHLSADAPAVDVAPAGAAPADAIVKNLAYPDATAYLALPGGTYDLEVRPAGDTAVALDLPGVAVEACNAYSVFAIGSAASPPLGGNALGVVVAVDETVTAAMTPPPTDATASSGTTSAGAPGLFAVLAVGGILVVATAGSLAYAGRRVRRD